MTKISNKKYPEGARTMIGVDKDIWNTFKKLAILNDIESFKSEVDKVLTKHIKKMRKDLSEKVKNENHH